MHAGLRGKGAKILDLSRPAYIIVRLMLQRVHKQNTNTVDLLLWVVIPIGVLWSGSVQIEVFVEGSKRVDDIEMVRVEARDDAARSNFGSKECKV